VATKKQQIATGAADYAEFIIGRALRDPLANPPYGLTGSDVIHFLWSMNDGCRADLRRAMTAVRAKADETLRCEDFGL
jgi:hypothetical protein